MLFLDAYTRVIVFPWFSSPIALLSVAFVLCLVVFLPDVVFMIAVFMLFLNVAFVLFLVVILPDVDFMVADFMLFLDVYTRVNVFPWFSSKIALLIPVVVCMIAVFMLSLGVCTRTFVFPSWAL